MTAFQVLHRWSFTRAFVWVVTLRGTVKCYRDRMPPREKAHPHDPPPLQLELTPHIRPPAASTNSRQVGHFFPSVFPGEKQETGEDTPWPRGLVLAGGAMASVSRLLLNDARTSASLAHGHAYHCQPHTATRAPGRPQNCLLLQDADGVLTGVRLAFYVHRISL